MAKPTIKEILFLWLRQRQKIGKRLIQNHHMQEVRAFGKARFGKIHNVSTYEREFRRAREKWPHRFKETKVEGVEKAWLIKEREPA